MLCCYMDADHCSAQEDTKSSSGMFLCLEGPSSFWPLLWASRKQTATARSTTEAEMISVGSGLFAEAIPTQEFLEQVFDRRVESRCYQDNAAVFQIVEAGYSPKLKHMNKTLRTNLGSIYECFKEDEVMKLLYIKTTSQRADPCTKPLQVANWRETLELMGVRQFLSNSSRGCLSPKSFAIASCYNAPHHIVSSSISCKLQRGEEELGVKTSLVVAVYHHLSLTAIQSMVAEKGAH